MSTVVHHRKCTACGATSGRERVGVLLVNLGTPDAADAPAVRRYLKEFLSDPAGDREPGTALAGRAQRHHPADPAGDQSQETTAKSGTSNARVPAQDHHPRAVREARPPRWRRSARTSWSTGRCATAIRRSYCGLASLIPRGLRAHSRHSALSAIFGRDQPATVCDEAFRALERAARISRRCA